MQDYNVGGHDPFSSYALGWGKAYIPAESMTINLKPFATSGEMILLTPNFNKYNSPFDEYILLEYYTPTGLNQLAIQKVHKKLALDYGMLTHVFSTTTVAIVVMVIHIH